MLAQRDIRHSNLHCNFNFVFAQCLLEHSFQLLQDITGIINRSNYYDPVISTRFSNFSNVQPVIVPFFFLFSLFFYSFVNFFSRFKRIRQMTISANKRGNKRYFYILLTIPLMPEIAEILDEPTKKCQRIETSTWDSINAEY